MNLISCNTCAVILDQSKMQFPEDIYTADDYGVDLTKGQYSQDSKTYLPYVNCPVCQGIIFKEKT